MTDVVVLFTVSDGRLYWFDTGLKYIASMNLDDGSDRQTLIASISASFLDMIVAGDELLVSYRHTLYVRCHIIWLKQSVVWSRCAYIHVVTEKTSYAISIAVRKISTCYKILAAQCALL